METRLGDAFVRVHRSVIVRRDRIVGVDSAPNGAYRIYLKSGERVRGGRSYRETILSLDLRD
jgi:two-component system, LytTR family, response regulator